MYVTMIFINIGGNSLFGLSYKRKTTIVCDTILLKLFGEETSINRTLIFNDL